MWKLAHDWQIKTSIIYWSLFDGNQAIIHKYLQYNTNLYCWIPFEWSWLLGSTVILVCVEKLEHKVVNSLVWLRQHLIFLSFVGFISFFPLFAVNKWKKVGLCTTKNVALCSEWRIVREMMCMTYFFLRSYRFIAKWQWEMAKWFVWNCWLKIEIVDSKPFSS